ncbi:MAG: GNAT family N-acetyltransferase [Bacteroidota bacterium]
MKQAHIIQTDRLVLRQFEAKDANGFYEMNADPEVIRHTGDLPFTSVEAAQLFIESYDHYQQYGFGRWTVLDRQKEEYLGFCGLKYSPDKQEVDLGFRLIRRYWGLGYATEAAMACLNYGFEHLQMEKIVGRARKDNPASIRVLEKIGMHFQKTFREEPYLWVQYVKMNHPT